MKTFSFSFLLGLFIAVSSGAATPYRLGIVLVVDHGRVADRTLHRRSADVLIILKPYF